MIFVVIYIDISFLFLSTSISTFTSIDRVPLVIAHPQSPFKGQHFSAPVESVDIYPTINELLKLPVPRISTCKDGWQCKPLDGKSLAEVVLGKPISYFLSNNNNSNSDSKIEAITDNSIHTGLQMINRLIGFKLSSSSSSDRHSDSNSNHNHLIPTMPKFEHDFAISQVIRCAPIQQIPMRMEVVHNKTKGEYHMIGPRKAVWNDCGNIHQHNPKEMSLLGYSMRTLEYRYTAYYPYPRNIGRPNISSIPYEEELYDHKNETLNDFTHRELQNLAYRSVYATVVHHFRQKLAQFIYNVYKRNAGNSPSFSM